MLKKIILGISTICLRLFFSHTLSAVQAAQAGLILNENSHKSTEALMIEENVKSAFWWRQVAT